MNMTKAMLVKIH